MDKALQAWRDLSPDAVVSTWKFDDNRGKPRDHVILALSLGGALIQGVNVPRHLPAQPQNEAFDKTEELICVYGTELVMVNDGARRSFEIEMMLDGEFTRCQLWEAKV